MPKKKEEEKQEAVEKVKDEMVEEIKEDVAEQPEENVAKATEEAVEEIKKDEKAEEEEKEVPKKPKAKKIKPAKEPLGIKVVRLPDIRGGICEFCGVHYSECDHYKGIEIRCSYCNRSDMLGSRILKLFEVGDEIIAVCDDYKCTNEHNNRYRT